MQLNSMSMSTIQDPVKKGQKPWLKGHCRASVNLCHFKEELSSGFEFKTYNPLAMQRRQNNWVTSMKDSTRYGRR